ncbi:hypothetical protein ABZ635_05930 [Nocardiopsis sp. NPDC007018]|uniref:hypothetical protein n=1 Tax=Nocardiopsis sp. NPDC007018 TaxID=3155721 RepID=UPI0033E83B27
MGTVALLGIAGSAVVATLVVAFPGRFAFLMNRLKTSNDKKSTENVQKSEHRKQEKLINECLNHLNKISEYRKEFGDEALKTSIENLKEINKNLYNLDSYKRRINYRLKVRAEQFQPSVDVGLLRNTGNGTYKILALPGLKASERESVEQFIERNNSVCKHLVFKKKETEGKIPGIKAVKKDLENTVKGGVEQLLESHKDIDEGLRESLAEIVDYLKRSSVDLTGEERDPPQPELTSPPSQEPTPLAEDISGNTTRKKTWILTGRKDSPTPEPEPRILEKQHSITRERILQDLLELAQEEHDKLSPNTTTIEHGK